MVEHFLSKCGALSSNLILPQQKTKNKETKRRMYLIPNIKMNPKWIIDLGAKNDKTFRRKYGCKSL